MLKPDERTLKALLKIQSYPEWKVIREWIDGSITDLLITSAKTNDEVASRWRQGGAQELLDIQSHLDNASKAIERIDNQK